LAARTIDATLSPPRLSSRISDYPTVSRLVRLQAQNGSTVTNQKGEAVRLTDLARHVVTLLDGAHSMDAVAGSVGEELQSEAAASDRIVPLAGAEELDGGRLTGRILRHLRDHALLVA
jgi:hypothetical protein